MRLVKVCKSGQLSNIAVRHLWNIGSKSEFHKLSRSIIFKINSGVWRVFKIKKKVQFELVGFLTLLQHLSSLLSKIS